MPVCKFYQEGRCKFGNQCRYEHIDPPGGGRQQSDPFNNKPKSHHSNGPSNGRRFENRIIWPLTAVALEETPEQGNQLDNDVSPEELRAIAYSSAPRGRAPDVSQKEAALVAEQQSKMQALGIQLNASVQSQQSQQHQPQSNAPPRNDPFANATPPPPLQPAGFGQHNGSAPGNPFGMQQQPAQQGFGSQTSNPFSQPAQPQGFGAAPQGFPTPQVQQPMEGFAPAPTPQMGMPQQQLPPMQSPAQIQQPGQMVAPPAQPAQPTAPAPAQPVAPNSQSEQQFNAAQFGFSKVPESAPPPQFY